MNAWIDDDEDLNRLFAQARDTPVDQARGKPAPGRTTLAGIVNDLFFSGQRVLSDRERAQMTDILRQLVHDVEIDIRQKLAARFSEDERAPRDLVLTLANDEIEVAHPILVNSKLLCAEELIEIIRHRTMEHQLAIAVRKTVSEPVADALIETGREDVVERLLENQGASFSAASMQYLVEQSQRVDRYQNPLLRRRELKPDLARRMYWWVSAALRTHILERFDIDADELDEAMERTTRELLNGTAAAADQAGPQAPRRLAEEMSAHSRLDPGEILKVLRQGEISFFEAMLTKLSGLRITFVRRILYEPGGEALSVLCRWANFSPDQFAELFRLTRRATPAHKRDAEDDARRLLDVYQTIEPELAGTIIKRWRRDPDYLRAIQVLNQSIKAPDAS